MTLKFIGENENVKNSFSFLWEETGLYIDVGCFLWGSDIQEYNIVFPENDWSRGMNNKQVYCFIKERITIYIDMPHRNYKKIINELIKECTTILKDRLNKDGYKLIQIVFEDKRIRI